MLTVYRLELKRSFTTVFGALILGVLLLCNGVVLTVYNLAYGTASLTQTQDLLTILYLVLIPILACRALPQERRDGTDLFLYSLPISSLSIAVGKYLAIATVLGLSFVPLLISPIIFSAYGASSVVALLIHWITFFLLCLLLLAICYCLSAFVKRPIYAALLGVGALVLIYLFPLLTSVTSNRLLAAEPFHHLLGASYGRLDLVALALYIGGIALCVLIVACVIEHRRMGLRNGEKTGAVTKKTIACAVLAICLVTLSIVSPLLPQTGLRPAVATDGAFALSGETGDVLADPDKDITLLYLCDGGAYMAQGALYSFLCDYAERSPRVTLRVIDAAQETDTLAEYEGVDALENMSVIVESESRYRVINNTELYYYYNPTVGNYRITPEEYAYFCNYLAQVSATELYSFVAGTVSYFDGEAVLTNAIRYCLQPTVPTVYTFGSAGALTPDVLLLSALKLEGYDCRALRDAAQIPSDCALLMINTPTKDLTDAEAEALGAYLSRGGKVFLTTESSSIIGLPVLRGLLARYGMTVSDTANIVCEGREEYCYSTSSSSSGSPNLFLAHVNGSTELTGDFDGAAIIPNAHAIYLTEMEGIAHTRWLYTSDSAYAAEPKTGKNLDETDARASFTVGALAQGADGGSILWISSPSVASSVADAYVYGGNFKLLFEAIRALTSHQSRAISISAEKLELSMISVGNGALAVWSVLLCAILPLAVLISGCVTVYVRRRR